MSLHRHLGIAATAFLLGYLDPRRFAAAIADLDSRAAAGNLDHADAQAVWLAPGVLTADQLHAVLEAMAEGNPGGVPGPGTHAPVTRSQAEPAPARAADSPEELEELEEPEEPKEPKEIDRLITQLAAPGAVQRGAFNTASPRYQHLTNLGAGGVATVIECYDTLLERRVAVKRPRDPEDPRARSIIEREARIIAALEHPNIVPLYDAGYEDTVWPYYVMRVVTQPSLRDVLVTLERGDARAVETYSLKRLLRYFVQVCQAVHFAHSRGIVHCDLKPANVLLGSFGECLVVDWGLAQSPDFPPGPRGGTPGFMAPEQFDRQLAHYDGRTDVFALGAILYLILSLRPPFPGLPAAGQGEELVCAYAPPPPPSALAPGRGITPELEEACLAALELDRERRLDSAARLAAVVEDYLEGTRQQEHRKREAETLAAHGDELAARHREFVDGRPEALDGLAGVRAQVAPWADIDQKLELWNAEELLAVTDALRMRTLQAAVAAYEQALQAWPEHEGARRRIADIYWAERERARLERDELSQFYFEQLARQYDPDRYGKRLDSPGRLWVVGPLDARAVVIPWQRDERRVLVRGPASALELDGCRPAELGAGSYLVEAEQAGVTMRVPVLIQPGDESRIWLDFTPLAGLDDDELFIAAGPALVGERGNGSSGEARLLAEPHVAAFAIKTWPVSFREYLAFVDHLRARHPEQVAARVPQDHGGVPLWQHDGVTWQPVRVAACARDALALPAFGVSAACAEAYAAWLSERTGRPYRLPLDVEWEKAARGADGRAYPWGDHFDPTFCKMRSSRPGPSLPEVSGAFPVDQSPYGVRDLAGGVADWTIPDDCPADAGTERMVYSRGGAWCDWAMDCRASARRAYWASERAWRVGFRLVRSL